MLIDKERVNAVVEYVNQSDRYTFENFINEHSLQEGMLTRATDLVIKCPFHEDYAPSCSMNDKLHIFNCFSCGRGGSYIKFLTLYSIEVEGIKTGYYQKVNELLRVDAAMQAALGYGTIFRHSDLSELATRRTRYKFMKGPNYPLSYLELSSTLMEKNCSEQDIKMFVLMMQQGFSVMEIYNELYGESKSKLDLSTYDINEMLREDE